MKDEIRNKLYRPELRKYRGETRRRIIISHTTIVEFHYLVFCNFSVAWIKH